MEFWELAWTDWSLHEKGRDKDIALAIADLISAVSDEEARSAYWRLDGTVVDANRVFSSAVPTTRVILVGYLHATEFGKKWILELLGQIAARSLEPDEAWNPDRPTKNACLAELVRGASIVFDSLQFASPEIRPLCVDLVYAIGCVDPLSRDRARGYLRRALSVASVSGAKAGLIANCLGHLEQMIPQGL